MSLKVQTEDGALVPAPRNLPTELFVDFDRRDDDAIIAELQGAVVAEYVYSFKQDNATVMGLSLPGVMAVAQNMGGITCGQPVWTITDDEITCDISATDHKVGLTVWGTATESKVITFRNGGSKADKFARAKALSKAQRNAIRKVIPETVATKMLDMFINGQRPERQRPPAQALPRGNGNGNYAPEPPQAPSRPAVEVIQGDAPRVSPQNENEPATDPQLKAIRSMSGKAGWDDDHLHAELLNLTGKSSTTELTRGEASAVIGHLNGVLG